MGGWISGGASLGVYVCACAGSGRLPHPRAPLPQQRQHQHQQQRHRWCDHVTPAFPTQQYNTVSVCIIHVLPAPTAASLSLSPPSLPSSRLARLAPSLSVWRTARGPRYYQIWEMELLAAATAECLPARRPTVCPTNHRVSIHGALLSPLSSSSSAARLQLQLA